MLVPELEEVVITTLTPCLRVTPLMLNRELIA